MMQWMTGHPVSVFGLILWAAGILWLMPGTKIAASRPRIPGLVMSTLGVLALCGSAGAGQSDLAASFLFWLFAVGALVSGVLMITATYPVYSALWFAVVTLCTCGLFVLRSAPFLAAATIIVYAGAVIVTFLFVIMLAQQSGAAGYDQTSRQGKMATISAFVLLGAIVMAVQTPAAAGSPVVAGDAVAGDAVAAAPAVSNPATVANTLSLKDEQHEVGNLKGLGRSLFGDYLYAVEMAGTLLLIACIGAIAIAPRREQGTL